MSLVGFLNPDGGYYSGLPLNSKLFVLEVGGESEQ